MLNHLYNESVYEKLIRFHNIKYNNVTYDNLNNKIKLSLKLETVNKD